MKIKILLMLGIFLLLVACGTQQPATPTCDSKDCFITKANNCEDINMNVTEDFGMVNYASKGCVFKKTMIIMNATEEITKLFDGKSFTCKYEQGKFDSRWVNSIVFGIEYCEGELKDRIVDMLAFL